MSVPSEAERLGAISALYQSERTDGAALQTTNVAIVAIGVTYAAATAVFFGTEVRENLDALTIALLPLPAWVVSLFFIGISCIQSRRQLSCAVLEKKLCQIAQLTAAETAAVGVRSSEIIHDFRRGDWFVKVAISTIQAGAAIGLVLYTSLMIGQAVTVDSSGTVWLAPTIIYTLIAAGGVVMLIRFDRERNQLATNAAAYS